MTKHTITHRKAECIGCGACAAICPDFWEMDDEGLAHLKGANTVGENLELEINSLDAKTCNQDAAEACPVQIIKIEEKL